MSLHIYVYWDYSNIYIEAQHIAQEKEATKYGEDVGFRVRLDFKNLMQLVRKDRKVRKAVAAGSVPPEMRDVWRQLQQEGVQTEIIDRSRMGGAEHNLPDMMLQWQMLYDLANADQPATVILLTGDGAGWDLGRGFLPTLRSMKRKGWSVELYSWERSCNQRLKEWVCSNGQFIQLDEYYLNITYIKSSEFHHEWGYRSAVPLPAPPLQPPEEDWN